MDISNYISGVTSGITNQTNPKSIPATTVGQAFVDLANLAKTNVELKADLTGLTTVQNQISGLTSTGITSVVSTKADLSALTVTNSIVSGHTATLSTLNIAPVQSILPDGGAFNISGVTLNDVIFASTGSTNISQTIDNISTGETVTIVYSVATDTPTPSGIINVKLFSTNGDIGSTPIPISSTALADGQVHHYTFSGHNALANRINFSCTSAANMRLRYALVKGDIDSKTVGSSETGTALLGVVKILADTPTFDKALRYFGLLNGGLASGSFNSVTVNSIGDATIISTGGTVNASQPIVRIPSGTPATLIYAIDQTSPVPIGGISAKLYSSSGSINSNVVPLITDGKIRYAVFTGTTNFSDLINFATTSSSPASQRIRYALFKGDITSSAVTSSNNESNTLSAFKVFIDTMGANTGSTSSGIDTGLRASSLVKGIPVNNSYNTVNYVGFGEIELISTGTGVNNTVNVPIESGITSGKNATFVYRVIPRSGQTTMSGTPRVRLYTGTAAASNLVSLSTDSGTHAVNIAATATASVLQFYTFNIVLDCRIIYTLWTGVDSDTTSAVSSLNTGILNLIKTVTGDLADLRTKIATPYVPEAWTAIEKQPLIPSNMAFINGRKTTWYPRQMLRGRKLLDRLYVGFVNRGTTTTTNAAGTATNMYRSHTFDPSELLSPDFQIEVRDKTGNANDFTCQKSVNFFRSSTGQTGNQTLTFLGDSTASSCLNRLKRCYDGLSTGSTLILKGTKTTGDDGNPYDGQSGTSWGDWLGRSRVSSIGFNPFLRTATNTDLTNNPKLCFADDDPLFSGGTGYAPGEGGRTAYYDDNINGTVKASYSIFDWNTFRAQTAVTQSGDGKALSGSSKHIAVVQLGINGNTQSDTSFYGLAVRYCADNFKATFPNGAIIFSYLNDLSGVGSGTDGDAKWISDYEPSIRRLIQTVDNSTDWGNHIAIAPSWFYTGIEFTWSTTNPVTDPETGVITSTLSDNIHPQGVSANQNAEAILALVSYYHQIL